nr:SIR2 family protein [uncultured Chitinophaga sp.]
MIKWPDSLVRELADRRCIIFIGAGASAGCKNASGERPPTWEQFLRNACQKFVSAAEQEFVEKLIDAKQYLDAAEIIISYVDKPDLNRYYRDSFLVPDFQHYELHKLIQELDAKIVITTNYDIIYEKSCEPHGVVGGYITKLYTDQHILNEIRSQTRLIIKAHGCVKSPDDIVLTRSNYFEAKKKYPAFYNLLDSLFLVNTIVFIGCGLSDPDLLLTLENSNIAVPSVHPHYSVMSMGGHPALNKAIKNSYNIKLLEYENAAGDHANLLSSLRELRDLVLNLRTVS